MNKRLVLINQNTLESLEETDILKIIERFVKTGMEILSADFGFMFWKLDNQNKYQLIYTSPETPYKPWLPKKGRHNDKALKTRIPYFVTEPTEDLLPYMKSFAVIPIFYKDHQYGNIVLCFKKDRKFTPEEASLVMALGNSAAQVLTIHRAHKKTERESLKLLKQKDEFFNIVSHELKTPVTTIKGFSQILTEKLKKSDSQTQSFLEKINTQVDKLARLIDGLLDVSRIENGKLNFEFKNFELRSLMVQVVDALAVAIPSHNISFTCDAQFWIRGDSERIEQVLTNLITNAAKYSPSGSQIKVCLKQKDDQALILVEDFGFGIREADKAKVFKRFFQSRTATKENLLGLGLGLYIANSIVKHHGSELNFTSKKSSKGTIFYFSLPYYKYQIYQKKSKTK